VTAPRNLSATDAKRLSREWRRRTERPLGLLLDRVQTPFNVGSILRTAAALRVTHVWLAGDSATPSHEKTRKTSLGTERFVPWSVVTDVAEGAAAARAEGMEVVGVELAAGANAIADTTFATGGACLVLGHEDRGLSAAALAACDRFAYIPLPGKVGSLNVATAAAIALYEVRRQEWTAPTDPTDRADAARGSDGSDPERVDLDAEAARRASGGGEGVGESRGVRRPDEPPAVVGPEELDGQGTEPLHELGGGGAGDLGQG
jgi:tRNA (guanosine-2'-O-)-methyltransferase